jgi:hypothetical protein
MFTVITQRYVRDNAATTSKKVDDKCLILDFVFLQSITNPDFVEEYMSSLRGFVSLLNDPTDTTGKLHTHTHTHTHTQHTYTHNILTHHYPVFILTFKKSRFCGTNSSLQC